MSPRMWLLLFLLTCAIGVTIAMVGDKKATTEEVPAAKAEAGLEQAAPVVHPPVEPEAHPTLEAKKMATPGSNEKQYDSNALPGPSDSGPSRASDSARTAPTPKNDDPYNAPPPVDGSPGYSPPTAYPPPAYPPPVYPEGGFEGDPPAQPMDGVPGYDPEGVGAPPGGGAEEF